MSTSGMHRRPFEGRHLVDMNPYNPTCVYSMLCYISDLTRKNNVTLILSSNVQSAILVQSNDDSRVTA